MLVTRNAATLVATLLLLALPRASDAQRACKSGTPCGRSCISPGKVCRAGAPPGSPSPAPATTAPTSEPKTEPKTEPKPEPVKQGEAPATDSATGPGAGKVWLNRKSRVYHCPGSRWFGATADGIYMSEKEAIAGGNRGMRGKTCAS